MSNDRSGHVYRLHSTLELPLEKVHEFFDDADLPEGVADVEITRRNNTLILRAVAADESISKYTPTAQLKASITENRVYEEEPPARQPASGPAWGTEEEEEPPASELVEFAAFKGDRETVLQNSKLQYQMFCVLRNLALEAEKGTLTAITAMDGELNATYISEGQERPASIEVTEGPRENGSGDSGVDWRDNKFISE